jgi:hypothetical protein
VGAATLDGNGWVRVVYLLLVLLLLVELLVIE